MNIGIGVDVGGSHISCCAVDLKSGQPIKGTRFDRHVDRKASKEKILETWSIPINQAIETLKDTTIAGIGFAMPGSFNYKDGVALFEGNDKYENLYEVNVKTELSSYLEMEEVELRFINDASAFGMGSAWSGQAKPYEKSIALTLGTGLGASFIEAGVPVVQGTHIPIHGSLWHLPFKDGIADDYLSTRWFVNTYKQLFDQRMDGVKEIALKAKDNKHAKQLFTKFGENLAEFLLPWLRSFQPESLIIGGNVSKSWFLMESSFQLYLNKNNHKLRVLTSTLMEDAALIGSARLLDEEFWNKVKNDLPEQ